jgi:hypothetical protein
MESNPRPDPILSPLNMFLCTFESKIDNICIPIAEFIDNVVPRDPIVAINCNFGHTAQPGFEHFLKLERKVKISRTFKFRKNVRTRKLQGDGTCFNSAVEPIVRPWLDDRIFKVKCFTTTGVIQVPGVRCHNFSDGRAAVAAWATFVNEQMTIYTEKKRAVGIECEFTPVRVVADRPIMINYNCFIPRADVTADDPYMILDLDALVDFLESDPNTPFPIQEVKAAQEDMKIAFKFMIREKTVRINIFLRGKINILGVRQHDDADLIYLYLQTIFNDNWDNFTIIKPRPDADCRGPVEVAAADLVSVVNADEPIVDAMPIVDAILPANIMPSNPSDVLAVPSLLSEITDLQELVAHQVITDNKQEYERDTLCNNSS